MTPNEMTPSQEELNTTEPIKEEIKKKKKMPPRHRNNSMRLTQQQTPKHPKAQRKPMLCREPKKTSYAE